ncbi:hypothetical protein ACQUQU_00445 [Thalassolituus sp. LLYu03]|uniref:hypothetical protein n=1 Tax=Thalassolituus sp. LLYu03 TaxID=3421656 RepID=UPI003D2D6FF7
MLSLLVLSGCAAKPASSTPHWLTNPGDGVVASCGFNIKGRYAQEQCAQTRAREQLAARQGVDVSSVSLLTEQVRNEFSNVTLAKETRETVNKTTVKARVVDSWYDAQRDEYYVWMKGE